MLYGKGLFVLRSNKNSLFTHLYVIPNPKDFIGYTNEDVFNILSSFLRIQNELDTKSTKKHSKSNKRIWFVLTRKSMFFQWTDKYEEKI